MPDCTTCGKTIELQVPDSGYRCFMCNKLFCKEHGEQHFGAALVRAEAAEDVLRQYVGLFDEGAKPERTLTALYHLAKSVLAKPEGGA